MGRIGGITSRERRAIPFTPLAGQCTRDDKVSLTALTISDVLVPHIYSSSLKRSHGKVDLVISCGDLPYYYLEYIVSSLDVPLYFVRGNHDSVVEHTISGPRRAPLGATDVHRRIMRASGMLIAGVEGCLRYRRGTFQYSQGEMWGFVLRMVPGLIYNRLRYGRFLDIFVTHAPSWGIHDQEDLPHRGIKAFRWLIRTFQPAYHFHGHIHLYKPGMKSRSKVGSTEVINTYGFCKIKLEPGENGRLAG
jgi:hypothetical protein